MTSLKLGLRWIDKLVLLGIMVIAVIALFLMLPFHRGVLYRESARRLQCLNDLGQIGQALQQYQIFHLSFPPAYTVDEEGNRLHSWRTLILPQLGEQELYDIIDLTKPWDDPANASARETIVNAFHCPGSSDLEEETCYQAVVGEGFAFTGSEPTKMSDIEDGAANTLLLVGTSSQERVPWMSPQDINEATLLAYNEETRELPCQCVIVGGFADGHAELIQLTSPPEVRRAMLTIAGGEKLSADDT